MDDIGKGGVDTLVLLGGNPVYDAPSDIKVGDALAKSGLTTIHLSSHRNETSALCTWTVPRAHELETWGDGRSLDGTLSVQQPLIAPLWGGRSDIELMAFMAGVRNWRGHYVVRDTMRAAMGNPVVFERMWRRTLQGGLLENSSAQAVNVTVDATSTSDLVSEGARAESRPLGSDNLEVVFAADPKMFDGRHANNPWLLELPDTVTKLCWDNAALLSPATAKALGVQSSDVVRLSRDGASPIEIVAWVVPGQADWVITTTLGWGRTKAGLYGNGVGFDVHPLRTSKAFGFADGVRLERTGRHYNLAQTQTHGRMEGRPLVVDATLADLSKEAPDAPQPWKGLPSYQTRPRFGEWATPDPSVQPLWKRQKYTGYKWGMAIDLSACTGCNACMVACQSENNVPVVGSREV